VSIGHLTPGRLTPTFGNMLPPSLGYRARLNALSVGCLAALVAPPFALAYAIFGIEAAFWFVGALVLVGVVRAGGNVALPGTVTLSPREAPGLFALVESLARRAGLKRMPEVRIVPGGPTNAAATLRGSRPVLVITEALMGRLDVRRLGAVLAHETAHLAHRDLVLFRLASTLQAATLTLGFLTVFLAVLSLPVDPTSALLWMLTALASPVASRLSVALLSRTREFAADLGAARLTGDPLALADALAILEYRPKTLWDWVVGRRSPLPADPAGNAFRTHPSTPERILRLDLLARASH